MAQLRLSTDLDRFLMQQELKRLEQRGFSFQGETEEQKLGADAWILGVKVVEEKTPKEKGKGK